MALIKSVIHRIKKMHNFSKRVFLISITLAAGLYISAIASFLLAPHVPDYFRAMSVYHGALEAAPATIVAGICAAIISDMALTQYKENGKNSK